MKKLWYLCLIFPVFMVVGQADLIEEIKRKNAERIKQIKEQGRISRERIKARYTEFLSTMKKLDRDVDLQMPIAEANARNVIDHNARADDDEVPRIFGIVTEDYTLREAGSADSKETSTTVDKDDRVEVVFVIRKRNDPVRWCLVRTSKDEEGFMPHLKLRNEEKDMQDIQNNQKKAKHFVNTSAGLNMREKPDASAAKILTIPYQGQVVVLKYGSKTHTYGSKTGKWAYVDYNGDKGWVFSPYLSESKGDNNTVNNNTTPQKGFVMPVDGRISSKYGGRIDPITKKVNSFHRGIDIVARKGTPIKAAAAGRVYLAKWAGGYGRLTILQHGNNLFTYYAHQSKWRKTKGSSIAKGEILGYVGTSGRSTGPHLHFEVRKGKKAFNPNQVLPK